MITAVGINISSNIRLGEYSRKPLYARTSGCDTVSFTSGDLLSKSPKDITKIVKSAIKNQKNIIGSGREGVVYNIPATEYCIKIMQPKDNRNPFRPPKPEFGKWNFYISPQEKVNHVVAKNGKKIVIMKKIKGQSLRFGEEPYEICELPKESYKNLLIQIRNAYEQKMLFDAVPENIIYDKENKTLTAIDFFKSRVMPDFKPFTCVYKSLMIKSGNKSSSEMRKKLGERLFEIAAEEVSNKETNVPLIKKDLDDLYLIIAERDCLSEKTIAYKKTIDKKIGNDKPRNFFSFLLGKQ